MLFSYYQVRRLVGPGLCGFHGFENARPPHIALILSFWELVLSKALGELC